MKILIPISGKSNRVILRQETLNEETNLMLPESQKKETFIGVVESTSSWVNDNNVEFPPLLQKGQLVLFQRMGAYRFDFLGKELVTMRESEIIGIIIEN